MNDPVLAAMGLDEAGFRLLLDEHAVSTVPGLEHLWLYYRNPRRGARSTGARGLRAGFAGVGGDVGGVGGVGGRGGGGGGGGCVLGQEIGLPSRITGSHPHHPHQLPHLPLDPSAGRREVVIENDIAWRIQSMVDFMFGKPIRIASADPDNAPAVDALLDAVWEASGGIALLQDMALLGHVFGWVDLLIVADPTLLRDLARSLSGLSGEERAAEAAAALRAGAGLHIEVIDPRRGIPVCDASDFRRLTGYIVHYETQTNTADPADAGSVRPRRARTRRTRLIAPGSWAQFVDDAPAARGDTPWTLGRVPLIHIQNSAEPWSWPGVGEVEPLIGLQDELNTRLSDRANRITLQCFKMYLAKGLDGFDKAPVAPGQVWTTDNPDASITPFGGDAASPSEDEHIRQIREALDKVSGIPPIAGGVVQGRIGNLSSANALRVTLMSILAKTARKRVTYGRGIADACGLILAALDWSGVLRTPPAHRGVRVEWPDPLPIDEHERVLAAEGRVRLGAPRERVLAELGYGSDDVGVQ